MHPSGQGARYNFYDLESGGGVYMLQHEKGADQDDGWYLNRYSLDGYWISSYTWENYHATSKSSTPNAEKVKAAVWQSAVIKACVTAINSGLDPFKNNGGKYRIIDVLQNISTTAAYQDTLLDMPSFDETFSPDYDETGSTIESETSETTTLSGDSISADSVHVDELFPTTAETQDKDNLAELIAYLLSVESDSVSDDSIGRLASLNVSSFTSWGNAFMVGNALGYTMGAEYLDSLRYYSSGVYYYWLDLLVASGYKKDKDGNTVSSNGLYPYYNYLDSTNTTGVAFQISRSTWDNGDFKRFTLEDVSMSDELSKLKSNSSGKVGYMTDPVTYGTITTGLFLQDVTQNTVTIVMPGVHSLDVFKKNFKAPRESRESRHTVYISVKGDKQDALIAAEDLKTYIKKVNISKDKHMVQLIGTKKSAYQNIYLFQSGTFGWCMVGDTLYPLKSDELAFVISNSIVYVNIRALSGWNQSIAGLVGNDGRFEYILRQKGKTYKDNVSTIDIKNADGTSLKALSVRGYNNKKCILMTGSYPLSNYIVVMNPDYNGDERCDGIFWVTVKYSSGSDIVGNPGDTDKALSEWNNLCNGIAPPTIDKANYILHYKELKRNTAPSASTAFMGYVEQHIRNLDGKSNPKGAMGYGYYVGAATSSAKSTSTAAHKSFTNNNADVTNLALATALPEGKFAVPIFNVKNTYYNMNLNTFSASAASSSYGPTALPGGLVVSGLSDNQAGTKYILNNDMQWKAPKSPETAEIQNGHLIPAYTRAFSYLYKQMGDNKSDSKSATYCGTMLCKITGKKITIKDFTVTRSKKANLNLAAVYPDGSTILTIPPGSLTIKKGLSGNSITEALGYANLVVDWEKYSFQRLTDEIDSHASLVLIFAMNILPRIGIFLFLVLMVLALMNDNPIAIRLTRKLVDPVRILTFGRRSLDTLDVKTTYIQSIIALGIFIAIMDNHLMNFISWCLQFFDALRMH